MEALAKAFRDPENVTVEEVAMVMKALKQDVPTAACEGIVAYCKAEPTLTHKECYATEVSPQKPGESAVYRSSTDPSKLWSCPRDAGFDSDAKTLAALWDDIFKWYSSLTAIEIPLPTEEGKPAAFKALTYNDVNELSASFGYGIRAAAQLAGLSFGDGAYAGLHLKTCWQWTVMQLAADRHNFATATMYDSLGGDGLKYVLTHTKCPVLVTSPQHLDTVLKPILTETQVGLVVVVGEPGAVAAAIAASPVKAVSFEQIIDLGRSLRAAGTTPKFTPPSPDSECLICFTSGTTGRPKGGVTTQGMMLASISASVILMPAAPFFPPIGPPVAGDRRPRARHIAFLPMAHVMEQWMSRNILVGGGAISYLKGPITGLADDLKAFRPTMFTTAPRVLNKFYSRFQAAVAAIKASDPQRGAIFDLAYSCKKDVLARTGRHRSPWDFIAFKNIREAFGGQVIQIASGSAPIAPDVQEFLRITVGVPVYEGYGMTEIMVTVAGPIGLTHKLSRNIGAFWPCCEWKYSDVPEMNYVNGPDFTGGELLVRGPTVQKGYLHDAENTTASMAGDWFKTGDIVKQDKFGCLSIIDRAKALFKLSVGEYVSPDKVEGVVMRAHHVLQAFVHAQSSWDFVVAVVSIDPEEPLGDKTEEQLLEHIQDICRKDGLASYEVPAGILVAPGPFETLDLMTPTLKLKRFDARKMFSEQLEGVYAKAKVTRDATAKKL